MISPETLDDLIAKIKIKAEHSSDQYSSVQFLTDGCWPEELRQLQVLTIHCADYISHRIAEKKFNYQFIEEAQICPPSIDLELPEHFEESVGKIILSTGISSSLIEEKSKQIKSRLIQFLMGEEFKKYEQTFGIHSSPPRISMNANDTPDLRGLLQDHDYGVAIARGAFFTGFYVSLFDFPTGVIRMSRYDRGNGFCQKISLTPEKIKGKKILVFEDDVQSGGTLEHFCKEIAAYEPASLSLLLSINYFGKAKEMENVLEYYQHIYARDKKVGKALPQGIRSRLISIETPSDLKQMIGHLSSQRFHLKDEYRAGKITEQEFVECTDLLFFLDQERDNLIIFLEELTHKKQSLTKADAIPREFSQVFYVDDFPQSPAVTDYLFERYNSRYHLLVGEEEK